MSTLMEQTSEKETKLLHNNQNDDEVEIDLMDLLRKVIGIRKKIYKAAGIGLVIGVIVAISIPKQYTVEVTLSPEMGNNKEGGLSGLAASFLGSGVTMGDGTDALNASLSADIVSSTPFLLELSAMDIPVTKNEVMTLNTYLDEETSPWWSYVIGFPGMVIGGVHSLTAIAAPHNGTSFIECNADFTKAAAELATSASKALGLSKFKGVYDFQLDQFGIRKDENETFAQALERVLKSDFLSHNDNAFLDLTIDKSLEINKGIAIQPNVYYFSYAGDQTSADPRTGNHYPTVSAIPSNGMCALMLSFSYNMGKYYDKYTAGGIYIDKSWLPNDGLVNTVSALYPTTTDKNTTECRKQDGSQGWVNYDGYSDIAFRPGIWYVMPVTRADHMQFVGGIANKSIVQTHLFYLNLMDDIYSTYRTVQPDETPFPFTDVPESRWSYPYIKQLYDAGVVSGMTATTFAPAENMTREQFVTMLAGLQGADVSAYKTGKFTDVPADAWYAPYVSWAAENGVVYGVSDSAFAPDANISRQDMAVMVYRYAERFGIRLGTDVPPVTFADAGDIAAYALPAVQALQRAGVISGMPDGSFRPREHMTREQACVVLSAL